MKETIAKLERVLGIAYLSAEGSVNTGQVAEPEGEPFASVLELANIKHAFRGAALTLIAYKVIEPDQDIRAHKDDHEGGFSARTFDNRVTIPFLIKHGLPRSVESHWLTQTLSFSPKLLPDVKVKTQPSKVGPLFVKVVNNAQNADANDLMRMLVLLLAELIRIRNRGRVVLTKPKNLSIDAVTGLLRAHFSKGYKSNTPRLPQLAMYAIYMAIVSKMSRFSGQQLDDLQRMKAADRKKGTVGDVVVIDIGGKPVEAVEIKYGQPITFTHVCEAVEKIRSALVSRYYLLSTEGISEGDSKVIKAKQDEFLKQNGCEIIVNGIVETIGYYLRLVPSTTEFVSFYAELVEDDEDTDYEHRTSWNELCLKI